MRIHEDNNKIIIENIKSFNLKHTFDCGQCFRWDEQADGSFTGIAYDRVINIAQKGNDFIIDNTNMCDFQTIWRKYFDLDRDYDEIKQELSKDHVINEASKFGWGIRILQQEFWECLISFIISSNNFIPRIKKIINSICTEYGDEVVYKGNTYYTLPKPDKLYGLLECDLDFCKSGYRCGYILDAARYMTEGGMELENFTKISTVEARKELIKIKGVGPKVADCILLFSAGKYDVFPTDVWIKKAVHHFYSLKSSSNKDISTFAKEKYGDLAGFAQQYLFFFGRELKSF